MPVAKKKEPVVKAKVVPKKKVAPVKKPPQTNKVKEVIKPLNLHQRISEVMKEVSYLQTDSTVTFGSRSYKGLSAGKIVQACRAPMIKHGITIYPMEYENSLQLIEGERTWSGKTEKTLTYFVDFKGLYKVVNVDDTTDFLLIPSFGHGVDNQDKSPGKAMTYSIKYVYMNLFMISSGDDPDIIDSDETVEKQGSVKKVTQKPTPKTPTGTRFSDRVKTQVAKAKPVNPYEKKSPEEQRAAITAGTMVFDEVAQFVKTCKLIEIMDVLKFEYEGLSPAAKKTKDVQDAKMQAKLRIDGKSATK